MRNRGFTIIEVMIVLVIIVVIMGAAIMFMLRGQEMVRQETLIGMLEGKALQVVERVTDDARRTGVSQLIPPSPQGYEYRIEFLPVVELDEKGEAVYGAAPVVYQLNRANGEAAWSNGLDDNGNGLVDEFVLRRFSAEEMAAGGSGTVIVSGVKGHDPMLGPVNGFRCRLVPGTNRLRVALTLQQRDRYGRLWERTHRSSVTLRND